MRLIDADAAIEALTEYGNGRAVYIGVEEAVRRIEQLPSAQSEQQWIPVTEESVIQAGYEGREVRFRIRGRLFAIRELAQ